MAEERINFRLEADDSALQEAWKRAIESAEEAQQVTAQFSDSSTGAFDKVADSIKHQDDVLKNTINTAADYNNQARRSASLTKQIAQGIGDAAKETEVFGVKVGDVINGLNSKRKALSASVKGVSGLTKAFRILRVAIISTGIGALVVALGSLVAFLAKTEKGMDIVNQALAAIGSTINVVVGRLATFGQAIGDLLKGDVKGFFNGARDSVQGFGRELLTAAGNAIQLQKNIQQLRDDQRAFRAETIADIGEVQRLNNILNDTNSTYTERKEALQALAAIERDRERNEIEFAQRRLNNVIAEQEQLSGLLRDKDAILNSEQELEEIKAEAAANEIARQNELQGLIDEQRQKVRELREEYLEFVSQIRSDARNAEIDLIDDPVQRLAAQRDLAVENLRARIEEARQRAITAGLTLPEDFDEQVAALFTEIDRKFAAEVQKIQAEGLSTEALGNREGLLVESITGQDFEDRLADASKDAVDAYVEGIQDALQDNRSVFDRIQDFFLDLFDVDEAQLRQIADSSLQIAGNLVESLDAFNQAQITKQDQVLQKLDQQIAQTESALQEEIEKRRAGFANDASLLEQSLEEQQAAREEAERKRLELEKKAANQRLAINSIEQASNYVLAATKLTAAEAGKGIVGLFTALAGLSLLLKVISTARAQSAQFDDIPKFRTGTEFIEGYGSSDSDSIVARVSRGERVLPAKDNKRIGGRALSNKQLVENQEFAESVKNLMESTVRSSSAVKDKMKSYSDPGVISHLTKEVMRSEREVQQVQAENNFAVMEKAYEKAAMKSAEKMISYWETRPIKKRANDGSELIEWKEGNKIRRQKVKKKP